MKNYSTLKPLGIFLYTFILLINIQHVKGQKIDFEKQFGGTMKNSDVIYMMTEIPSGGFLILTKWLGYNHLEIHKRDSSGDSLFFE